MYFQELDFFYQARTCHKDWSMRLEALANGLPVDMKKAREIETSCFVEDIKVFSPSITSYPYFSEFQALYFDVHKTIHKQMKSKGKISKKKAVVLTPKLKRLVEYFDELGLFLEKKFLNEEKKKKLVFKMPSNDMSRPKGKEKKERNAKKHDDVMDDLEQSMRELDEIL